MINQSEDKLETSVYLLQRARPYWFQECSDSLSFPPLVWMENQELHIQPENGQSQIVPEQSGSQGQPDYSEEGADFTDSGNIVDCKPFLPSLPNIFPVSLNLDLDVKRSLCRSASGTMKATIDDSPRTELLLSPAKILSSQNTQSPFKLHRVGLPGSLYVTPEEYMKTRAEQRMSQAKSSQNRTGDAQNSPVSSNLSPGLKRVASGTSTRQIEPPKLVKQETQQASQMDVSFNRENQPQLSSYFTRRDKRLAEPNLPCDELLIPGTQNYFPPPPKVDSSEPTTETSTVDTTISWLDLLINHKPPRTELVLAHSHISRKPCIFRNYYEQVKEDTQRSRQNETIINTIFKELSQSPVSELVKQPQIVHVLPQPQMQYVAFSVLQAEYDAEDSGRNQGLRQNSVSRIDQKEDSLGRISEVRLDELMCINTLTNKQPTVPTEQKRSPSNRPATRSEARTALTAMKTNGITSTAANIIRSPADLLDLVTQQGRFDKLIPSGKKSSGKRMMKPIQQFSENATEGLLHQELTLTNDYVNINTEAANLDNLVPHTSKTYPVVPLRSGLLGGGGSQKIESQGLGILQLGPLAETNTGEFAKKELQHRTRRRVLKLMMSEITQQTLASTATAGRLVIPTQPTKDANIIPDIPDGFDYPLSETESLTSGVLKRGVDYPRINLQPAAPHVKPVERVAPALCLLAQRETALGGLRNRRRSASRWRSYPSQLELTKSAPKLAKPFLGKRDLDIANQPEKVNAVKLKRLTNPRTGHSLKCSCSDCRPGSHMLRPRPMSAKKKVKKKDGRPGPVMLLGLDEILGSSRSSYRSSSVRRGPISHRVPPVSKLRTSLPRSSGTRMVSPTVSLERDTVQPQLRHQPALRSAVRAPGKTAAQVLDLRVRLDKQTSPPPVRLVSLSGTISIGSQELPRDPSPSIVTCESVQE